MLTSAYKCCGGMARAWFPGANFIARAQAMVAVTLRQTCHEFKAYLLFCMVYPGKHFRLIQTSLYSHLNLSFFFPIFKLKGMSKHYDVLVYHLHFLLNVLSCIFLSLQYPPNQKISV